MQSSIDILLLREKLQHDKELLFNVKIIPSAPHNAFVGIMEDGTVRIKVKAPPEKGKANKELVRFLSKELKVEQRHITIERGQTTTYKRLRITL